MNDLDTVNAIRNAKSAVEAIRILRAYSELREKRLLQQERQFILNVLDGVDIADLETGNDKGGTKAIRLALQMRYLPK